MFELRLMTPSDIDAGLALCRSAGWNQVRSDWQLFLDLSPNGCFVAVNEDHQVVGTVATIVYEERFAWIGMVLVDPSYKRQGIGTRLLNKALEILDNIGCIKLDATPAGREVYLKLNFEDEYGLTRMLLSSASETFKKEKTFPHADLSQLTDVIANDTQVFGASRQKLLESLYHNSPALTFTDEHHKAYCFGRQGHNYLHVGPVVAEDFTQAKQLLASVALSNDRRPLLIDVPHHSKEWLSWLKEAGFKEQRVFTRMYNGKNLTPGIPHLQYAILGPEFG